MGYSLLFVHIISFRLVFPLLISVRYSRHIRNIYHFNIHKLKLYCSNEYHISYTYCWRCQGCLQVFPPPPPHQVHFGSPHTDSLFKIQNNHNNISSSQFSEMLSPTYFIPSCRILLQKVHHTASAHFWQRNVSFLVTAKQHVRCRWHYLSPNAQKSALLPPQKFVTVDILRIVAYISCNFKVMLTISPCL